MANKVWTGIASLFGVAPNEGQTPPRSALTPQTRAARFRVPSSAQAAALDTYSDAIAAGRVHILDLGAIKAEMRDQWGLVKERVATAVDGILRHRLTVSDLHSRIDDSSYLLVLHSRTGEEARMLCSLIALEVRHKLFGEDRDLGEIRISKATASESGAVDLVEIDASEAVAHALKAEHLAKNEEVRAAARKDDLAWKEFEHTSHKPAGEMVPVKDALRSLDVALSSVARSIEMPPGALPGRLETLQTAAKHIESETEIARRVAAAQAIEDARRRADVAAAAATAARQREQPAEVVDSIGFAYEPIWDCRRHAVIGYALDVKFKVGDREKSLAEVEGWATRPEILASIDLLSAKKGLADMAQMLSHGHKAILSISMHRAVLENPARRAPVLSLFNSVLPEVRKLVRIEIVDAYAGDWDLLPVLLATWRRACRDVVLRLSLDQADVKRLKAAGVKTIGGDLRDHQWPENQAMKKMEAFALAATKAGLESYIYGVRSLSELVCAACAGYQHLAGSAIMPEIAAPAGVYALNSMSFYFRDRPDREQAG